MSNGASKQTEATVATAELAGADDATLVERVRAGQTQAFGLLVERYQDRVFNLALRMCSHRLDAEELAQEAFLKALERIDQFKGNSKFYTWLFRIAANLAISHRRRRRRLRFLSLTRRDGDGDAADPPPVEVVQRREPPPEQAAMAAETRGLVAEALEQLDETFRLVLVLRDMQDMGYAEIAEVLSVPVGTVKSRLYRARCMLRAQLDGKVL